MVRLGQWGGALIIRGLTFEYGTRIEFFATFMSMRWSGQGFRLLLELFHRRF